MISRVTDIRHRPVEAVHLHSATQKIGFQPSYPQNNSKFYFKKIEEKSRILNCAVALTAGLLIDTQETLAKKIL